jgi:hypothetical protein
MPQLPMHDPISKLPVVERQRRTTLKDNFLSMTPNEAGQWVEMNVNNLASAKRTLVRMAKILNAVAHKVDNI